jgi:nucleoid DNA-binding protein
MAKAAASKKPPTKGQIFTDIAEKNELNRKQVAAVFDSLGDMIKDSLSKKGPGVFVIPGLCKIILRSVDAKPKRKVRNPANGEEMWAAPKPASKKVVVRPLKALKDMVN